MQNGKHAVGHSRFVKGFCWKTSTFKIRTSVVGETRATREKDDNGNPIPTDPDSRLHFTICNWQVSLDCPPQMADIMPGTG